jgi:hypothetical protein
MRILIAETDLAFLTEHAEEDIEESKRKIGSS